MITQKPLSATAWLPPPRDWAEEQAYNVAMEIRRLRGKLSAQKLSERTKKLGCEVTRTVLSDLENGRRRHVTVAELTVLAMALNTTPVALLYPDPVNGDTEMLPGVKAGQGLAMQWFSGHVDTAAEPLTEDLAAYKRNVRRIELAREIWELDGQRAALMKARADLSGPEKREYLLAMAELTRQVAKLKAADDGR